MALWKSKHNTRNLLNIIQIEDYNDLLNELKRYISSKKELNEIKRAYDFAFEKHSGQYRKNGDPYIFHPLSTAYYLAQLKMGPKTIISGLLHDILEDTAVTYEELSIQFGTEVGDLVKAVTKVSYFAKENRQQQKSVYLRKIYLSMAKDIRVIIIKLADRMHNMLTIKNLRPEKQKIIATETLEIYSAIAHRIGMKQVKSILEDMSFQILNPIEYDKIENLLKTGEEERVRTINEIINDLDVHLRKEKHIKILDIFGRPKTVYSIYRKMNQFGHSFDDINDLLAIRIIVKSVDDCYKVLGFIHQFYTPIAKRFKDYIATPKNGVYQSLHTTLSDKKGNIFEVQIRTEEMDKVAESGAAAHWAYKEGEVVDIKKRQKEIDEQIDIFKRIIDLDKQQINENGQESETIEKVLKEDFFTTMIYVMTPDKKVITLPFGSTVLDFAYRIHSEVGEHTIGAKINGVFSPINTVLASGQIVEVKTSQRQFPTHEWLKIVATSNARNRIKKFLTHKMAEDNLKDRKDEIKSIAEKIRSNINSYINQHDLRWKKRTDEQIELEVKKLGYPSVDEFLFACSKGEYTIAQAVNLVYIDQEFSKDDIALEAIKTKTPIVNDYKNDILVDGISNIAVSLASCCMPIPYEPIVGYVSKGNGIKVHLIDCVNVMGDENSKRLVNVKWNPNVASLHQYATTIKYFATNRPNLLYDISKVLNGLKAVTLSARFSSDEKKLSSSGTLKIKVNDSDQLNMIISALKSVPAVNDVMRLVENKGKK